MTKKSKNHTLKVIIAMFVFCICDFFCSFSSFAAENNKIKEDAELLSYFSNRFYYVQLTENEKKLYDTFEDLANNLLFTDKDLENQQFFLLSPVNYIKYELTQDDAIKVAWLFYYENPQYYFIKNSVSYNDTDISIGCYPDYATGSERQIITNEITKKMKDLIHDIDKDIKKTGKNDYSILKSIHDMVCKTIRYEVYDGVYDQSIIMPLIIDGTGVCTVYAKLFNMLCSYYGYDCYIIGSKNHAWNCVNVEGNWYCVDCTWDDTDDKNVCSYTFFLTSQSRFDNYLYGNEAESHSPTDLFSPYCAKLCQKAYKRPLKVSIICKKGKKSEKTTVTIKGSTGTSIVVSYNNKKIKIKEYTPVYYTSNNVLKIKINGRCKINVIAYDGRGYVSSQKSKIIK